MKSGIATVNENVTKMTYKVTVTYALYVYYLMLLLHLKAGQCIQYGGGGGGRGVATLKR